LAELGDHGVTIEKDWGWDGNTWIEGAWLLSELELALQGIRDLASAIGSELNNGLSDWQNFRNVVGPVTMRRVREKNACGAACTWLNTITLYNGAFDHGHQFSKEAVVHETAHAWDWNRGKQPSMLMFAAVGTEKRPTNRAARADFSEHWAETVEAWVYPDVAARDKRSLGPRHSDYVRREARGEYAPFIPSPLLWATWGIPYLGDRLTAR
jgi:hypothetical protein